jgi:hypothetical protein
MLRKAARSHGRKEAEDFITRPTAFTLVIHIFRALLVDGLILLVSAVAVFVLLYQADLLNEPVVMLVFTGIALIALLRGCAAWQGDLTDYQRYLAIERHKTSLGNSTNIPGFYASRNN